MNESQTPKNLTEELVTCLITNNITFGSADLLIKLYYDVDANLFSKEDPVCFLRAIYVEIGQNWPEKGERK